MKNLKEKIKNKTAKICIIGLGYVGLPTAVHFSEKGFRVIGVDVDDGVVSSINDEKCNLKDLSLRDRVARVVREGKLRATIDTKSAVEKSDVVLIIVPTPITKDKRPILSHIEAAGREIMKGLKKGQLVVLESTVYPGVTEEILKPILESSGLKAGEDFGLAYCPERYNPGDRKHTIEKVDRIVAGITPEWGNVAKMLYQTIIKEVTLVKDIKTAEAAKVIENIQRDLNIALMNELALIFEKMDIDIMDVIEAAKSKWNFNVYYPGAGVGGHCLPVDPYYLTHKAEELGYHPQVILAGRSINDSMPKHVVDLAIDGLNEMKKSVRGSKIAILGIAYKANTDDLRGSPAKIIIETLLAMKANVCIHDPYVNDINCQETFGLKNDSLERVLKNADCTILITDHIQFKKLNVDEILEYVKPYSLFVDTRNVFDPKDIVKHGLVYRGIGRRV